MEEINTKLILKEGDSSYDKPNLTSLVEQNPTEQNKLRSDIEFLSMMTGIDLGGD